jgi:hypothetical protein
MLFLVGSKRDLLTGALSALLALTAAAAAVRSPPAAAAPLSVLKIPSAAEIGRVAPFTDTILRPSAGRLLAEAAATTEWGGAITATDGETVTIYFSDSYPFDQALALKWADFMTSLVHGTELSTVSIYLAPLTEVQRYCGRQAIACYSPDGQGIIAPGEDPDPQTSAEGVLTHEYGHHIADSRLNPPFATVDYGTKGWATYENVCARTQTSVLYPGAEDAQHYMLNPGEAFAESYRVLNEQKAGVTVEPWDIVTTLLYPDATALSLLEQDVTQPWAPSAATKLSATLTKSSPSKSFVVSTPYDGTLTIGASQSVAAKVALSVTNANGTSVLARTVASRAATPVTTTICGQRSYTVKVKLAGTVTKKTKTAFTLAVAKP